MAEIKTESHTFNDKRKFGNYRMFYNFEEFSDIPVNKVTSTRQLISDADTRDVLDLLDIPYRES